MQPRPARKIALTLGYDGTDFHGFQIQPGVRTVQGELERALERILGHPVSLCGAGRTDAGVHACGQVVSFLTSCPIPTQRLPLALDGALPSDLVARGAREVLPAFHARRWARRRRYRYTLLSQPRPSATLGRYTWWVPHRLDLARMRQAAASMVGEHDFALFSGALDAPSSTVCRLLRAACVQQGSLVLVFIEARSFLYQMVRRLVGVLVAVGRREREPEVVQRMLTGQAQPGPVRVAPPHGLCLTHVTY